MGDTKQVLIQSIKEWITINSNMSSLQKQLKELKDKKKNISSILIKIMENNDIDRVDINNGKLLYKKTTYADEIIIIGYKCCCTNAWQCSTNKY